jgi:hypothetical protein
VAYGMLVCVMGHDKIVPCLSALECSVCLTLAMASLTSVTIEQIHTPSDMYHLAAWGTLKGPPGSTTTSALHCGMSCDEWKMRDRTINSLFKELHDNT